MWAAKWASALLTEAGLLRVSASKNGSISRGEPLVGASFLRVLGAYVLALGSRTSTHKINRIGTQLKRKVLSFIDI